MQIIQLVLQMLQQLKKYFWTATLEVINTLTRVWRESKVVKHARQ
jgi:hypothetical protein